jgi:hypothetical protein
LTYPEPSMPRSTHHLAERAEHDLPRAQHAAVRCGASMKNIILGVISLIVACSVSHALLPPHEEDTWEAFVEIAHPTHIDFSIEACERAVVAACERAATGSCEDSDLLQEFAVCRVRACVDERTGPTDGISVIEACALCVVLESEEED